MKYSLVLVALLSALSLSAEQSASNTIGTNNEIAVNEMQKKGVSSDKTCQCNDVQNVTDKSEPVLKKNNTMLISVVGQGVAPMNTASPAQAYALAKRAAVADAYRLIAEKVKGVRIDGQDLIKNMMVKRSTVRTSVSAMVRNANVVETTFKEGLCEVEMEIVISHAQFK
jgi:hypothetical protein